MRHLDHYKSFSQLFDNWFDEIFILERSMYVQKIYLNQFYEKIAPYVSKLLWVNVGSNVTLKIRLKLCVKMKNK